PHSSATAEGAQPLVAELRDLLGRLAAQDVDQVADAEARPARLLEPVDARERHPRRLARVPGRRRRAAVVARVLERAARRARFAEVGEQAQAPAVVRLGEREQRVELAALVALELLAGRALLDHPSLVDDVGEAVRHPGVGGKAVAAGAASLLVIALDVL